MTQTRRSDRETELANSVLLNARIMGPPWTCYLCPTLQGLYAVTVVAWGGGWKLIWSASHSARMCECIVDTKEQAARKLVDLEVKWAREARRAREASNG